MDQPKKPKKPLSEKPVETKGTRGNPQDEKPMTPRKREGLESGQRGRRRVQRTGQPPKVEDDAQIKRSPPVPPSADRPVSAAPSQREPMQREKTVKPIMEPPSLPSKPKEESKLPIDHPLATLTGFKELKISSASLIGLLWLPRYFIPWITAWHEFNVYILSNPYHWAPRQGDLDKQELYAFTCSCLIAISSSVLHETLQKKFDLKYYLFILLLILYTLSPVVGGVTDVLLRAGFTDNQLYTDWWFTGVVTMRWAMGFSFAMFPIQFACIYAQNNNMSRNAHYNWSSVFLFLEFLNAYIAFWVIPPKCPTREWVQIVVWVGIGILLVTVSMMCLIFFFAVPTLKNVMMKFINYCRKKKEADVDNREPDPFVSLPSDLRNRKMMWCSLILLPVVFSYFSFAVLERFVPDEDWDKHYLWSATSMFLLGRTVGVAVMVMVMFGVRAWFKNHPTQPKWRAEMFYMGVPHVFSVLALATLFGRFATLSHLQEGDTILGPIPDDDKAVLLMFNFMMRNRTVCVTSEHFRPVKIRPFQYATRELYDDGVKEFKVNVTVDPCSDMKLQTHFIVNNFTKGDWVVFGFTLTPTNSTNEYVWDYYAIVRPIRLLHVEHLRPTGVPRIVVFTTGFYWPKIWWYHQFNHSGRPPIEVMVGNTYNPRVNASLEEFLQPRKPAIVDLPETGKWRATTSNYRYNLTAELIAWAANSTYIRNIGEFDVFNFSLYYLIEYVYRESEEYGGPQQSTEKPQVRREAGDYSHYDYYESLDHDYYGPLEHDAIPEWKAVGEPASFKLFKVAEIAGPESGRLPAKRELQQDWAIKMGLTLAGMAAGGLFLGFIYLFWLDPPVPAYRTTTLAVCWVFMGVAAEIPKIRLVDITVGVSMALLTLHVASTALHFTGTYFMYTPAMNSRIRED